MATLNSLSGGKTSSYMAAHYPADFDVFALICTKDPITAHPDKKLIQVANDRFERSKFSYHGEFIGTAEDDIILRTMLDLEQKIGREIIWVRDKYFEEINAQNGRKVPNMMWRYCTIDMKIRPIAEFVYKNVEGIVDCNIGIRMDEAERAKKTNEARKKVSKIQIGHRLNKNQERYSRMWKEVEWGFACYPLISDKIWYSDIKKWAENSGIPFAKDSNCIGCFWKNVQQLRKNWDDHPNKMEWFSKQEKNSRSFYKSGIDYDKIKEIGLQQEFNFGTGSGCQAGFCTD